ncbi:MAG: HAD family hydrolase [Chloroflexota bacterium]|nr:HAD family hydrolase [Chloroflexota bacterium]
MDRDGVINVDRGYVHKKEDFDFCEGIFDLVESANRAGYRVIVVTNQAGIARGYYSEDDFKRLTHWMLNEFKSRNCRIDQVYFCPFHPTAGHGRYLCDHDTRKPRPGMFLKALSDFNLNAAESLMIGDKESDMIAAAKAGVVKTFLLNRKGVEPTNTQAFAVIENLRSACGYL